MNRVIISTPSLNIEVWNDLYRFIDSIYTIDTDENKVNALHDLKNGRIKEKGIKIDAMDCLSLAQEAGSPKAVNIVLLGRLSHYFDIAEEAWQAVLNANVPPKFLEVNKKAFELGKNYQG